MIYSWTCYFCYRKWGHRLKKRYLWQLGRFKDVSYDVKTILWKVQFPAFSIFGIKNGDQHFKSDMSFIWPWSLTPRSKSKWSPDSPLCPLRIVYWMIFFENVTNLQISSVPIFPRILIYVYLWAILLNTLQLWNWGSRILVKLSEFVIYIRIRKKLSAVHIGPDRPGTQFKFWRNEKNYFNSIFFNTSVILEKVFCIHIFMWNWYKYD